MGCVAAYGENLKINPKLDDSSDQNDGPRKSPASGTKRWGSDRLGELKKPKSFLAVRPAKVRFASALFVFELRDERQRLPLERSKRIADE
jgi:hypothetical protein